MNLLRLAARCIVMALPCLLVSCIDSREEFWLEANGSGRAELSFSIPTTAARMTGGNDGIRKMIEQLRQSGSALKNFRETITTQDDRTHIDVSFSFDSARDLEALREGEAFKSLPSAAAHMSGMIETEIRGLSIDYRRTIAVNKALPGAFLLPKSKFADCKLLTIMHLPVAASQSNATRVENAGRTLVWDTPMAEAVKSPIVHHIVFSIPIPRAVYIGLVAIVIALGVLIQRRRAKSARNRAVASPAAPAA